MQINRRRSRREFTKLDLGSGPLSGLHVSDTRANLTDHAHPLMIPGHSFKGGVWLSTGQLLHPDLKRFGLATAVFFKPPTPHKNPYDAPAETPVVPAFSDFFSSYFGSSWNRGNTSCSKIFDNMQNCYTNHMSKDPTSTCEHYINSFQRLSCTA